MTSFLTHRARVHDARLPVYRRHSALRTCLTVFAPYGLRATYHHLTLSAAIPRRLEADPDALVRAVEELHEARVLWLVRAQEYAVQRRAEKQAGRRTVPNPRPWWLRNWWESPDRAWFEDPVRHPSLRLSKYVRRQNALLDGAGLPGCPACGNEGARVLSSTGHGWVELCPECARVLTPCPCGRRHRFVPETPFNWNGIWRRAHMSDDGVPNPHWPERWPLGRGTANAPVAKTRNTRTHRCHPFCYQSAIRQKEGTDPRMQATVPRFPAFGAVQSLHTTFSDTGNPDYRG